MKRGDFDSIPDPIQQSAELWPLFEEFTGFRKDVFKFDNFSQTMRDKFELIGPQIKKYTSKLNTQIQNIL